MSKALQRRILEALSNGREVSLFDLRHEMRDASPREIALAVGMLDQWGQIQSRWGKAKGIGALVRLYRVKPE